MMGMIFIPQFAENAMKIPSGDGGYFVIILGLFAGAVSPISGKFIDKYGAKPVLGAGFIVSILGALYLALIATIVGYVIWGKLLQRYPVAEVAPLTLLVPVVGLLAARVLLDEKVHSMQWLGIALVLLGLLVNLFWPRWRQRVRRCVG